MTHTEALKMARETLAEVTDILDMALMIGLPTLPPGADGPAVKARAAIAALDALQSTQPATHTEALRALLSAVDMLTYPGEDQPQDPEPWGDWNNGNGDLCGPAMAAAIARARKALAQPSAEPAADLREKLTDAIAAGLHGTYHCTRGKSELTGLLGGPIRSEQE